MGGVGGKELRQTRLDALLTREERIKKQEKKTGIKKKAWFGSFQEQGLYNTAASITGIEELQSTDCNMGLGAFLFCFCYFSFLFFKCLVPTGLMESKHTTIQESDVYILKTHGGETELSQTDPWRLRRSPRARLL